MKHLRHIINAVIWTLFGLYIALIVMTHLPPVQTLIGHVVSEALSDKFGTEVHIGRVDLGFFNRIIIDDVLLNDQKNKPLIKASRLSAKISLVDLAQGRVNVSSAQLFGVNANFYKATSKSEPNYQFVLDALASKDTTHHTPLDISVHSLIIRNGRLSYDQLDAPRSTTFNPKHLKLSGISAHIVLNKLSDDSLNLNVKKLALQEAKGFNLKSLTFHLVANKHQAELLSFKISLPSSVIQFGPVKATYSFNGKRMEMASLQYEGALLPSSVQPADFTCFDNSLKQFVNPISLSCSFIGTSTSLRLPAVDIQTHNGAMKFIANGAIRNWDATPQWNIHVQQLRLTADDVQFLAGNMGKRLNLPTELTRLGAIRYQGELGGYGKSLSLKGDIQTDAGNMELTATKNGSQFFGHLMTPGFNLGHVLDNTQLGQLATDITLEGKTIKGQSIPDTKAKGLISRLDYKGYSYRNITVDGSFLNQVFNGKLAIEDPNCDIALQGTFDAKPATSSANLTLTAKNLNPAALGITKMWQGNQFNFNLDANITGNNLSNIEGKMLLSDLVMETHNTCYPLGSVTLEADNQDRNRRLTLNGDFGQVEVNGAFDYATFLQSITNLVASKLPTLPGLPHSSRPQNNNFTMRADINSTDWLSVLFNVPLQINAPIQLNGSMNDYAKQFDLQLSMPQFTYNGKEYRDGEITMHTPDDTLKTDISLRQMASEKTGTLWNIKALAADNHLRTLLSFDNNGKHAFNGKLDSDTRFFKDETGASTAHVSVHPSRIDVGDSVWYVEPSDIIYRKNHINFDNFAIRHSNQYILVNGLATQSLKDTVTVDLKGTDVSYFLNLLNFHAVDFGGYATGHAYISGVFSKPEFNADLMVTDFTFEDGRMGVLSAYVNMNNRTKQLDIDATAYDEGNARTIIKGYVSPQRNYIDLNIQANNTRGDFLEGFCSSFLDNTDLRTNGSVRVSGDLSEVNLTGKMLLNGKARLTPTNTYYDLRNAEIVMVPDDISFNNDTIADRNGNIGIVSGHVRHKHLTQLTYDLNISARNLLSYDRKDFGEDTFCGVVYATGNCRVRGRSGAVDIDINARPDRDSYIMYNAASPSSINNQQFIHWSDRADSVVTADRIPDVEPQDLDIPADIHINFIINCTPEATLKVLMDQQSGDYIALNGNGSIRATYFNKGDFNMFGTYTVDHGIYKLTIQNVIKRDFLFSQGGTITFGGDPYEAQLNLKAEHTVNSVSLSDLNIGNSFSSNNIRVNCLMNISGTPAAPRVDFDMDFPTINSDVKQMITSLINSEQEMNQQVIYLLAIGRFYSQGNNNASVEGSQSNRTSLAMQSIVSGQISQQLNNVLSTVINNTNWNFGANISTGDEGWNNAEYEGLLSGRMLNNRLIFNGQFGYRDNANATTSFIGDFDLKYLIYPNGNLAIHVYNQTNDRYFTRNSLNTQGIGLVMKKDFNGWRDLFDFSKKHNLKFATEKKKKADKKKSKKKVKKEEATNP